jgi:hypothetical protein
MASLVPHYGDRDEGGYLVRAPRVTDAIGGALQRSFAQQWLLPDDLRRLLDRLDRSSRLH